MDNIIRITDLEKSYGEIKAVDKISFEVERGSLFAFLGVNGAGKSTTINILSTLLEKDEGKVIIDGLDLDCEEEEIKKIIGIVFQGTVLDDKLSVKENLTVRASYYGLRGEPWDVRLKELTQMFDLEELLKRPFGKLSGGQRRRVDMARGLINYPKILFLDEPTTGLDPKTRVHIWEIINEVRKKSNMTVFLTTHYMEEAEKANKVVIIDKGRIIAAGEPNYLKNVYSGDYVKIYREKTQEIDNYLTEAKYPFTYDNGAYSIKVKSSVFALKFLCENKSIINDFEVVKGNMDDVFLNATGKKLEA
ncbi:ABC transporter ATP-binding protein [bacterium]|nr:ABC transporter ATP-binding protein [bacterium]